SRNVRHETCCYRKAIRARYADIMKWIGTLLALVLVLLAYLLHRTKEIDSSLEHRVRLIASL
ncbi:MAG: hypothetical protein ACRD7E_12130, partial [Bryobacteraceae bacterium]